jgi:hypothetical protein
VRVHAGALTGPSRQVGWQRAPLCSPGCCVRSTAVPGPA